MGSVAGSPYVGAAVAAGLAGDYDVRAPLLPPVAGAALMALHREGVPDAVARCRGWAADLNGTA